METLKNLFFRNVPQKIFALLCAVCIWLYINYSITETRYFAKVNLRIVNLPPDKTIRGMLPGGLLEKRLTVGLTGTKEVIDRLDRKDFEIVLDARDKPDNWLVQIDKRNLVCHNPDIDLVRNITSITNASDLVIHFSKLVTTRVPVYFRTPIGDPPKGYQLVDIFPQRTTHLVTGPEEDVKFLCEEGIDVVFDLGLISKEELDALADEEHSDEISFIVPDAWKRISIPFLGEQKQELNNAEITQLRIHFLRQDFLPVNADIPVCLFYPVETIDTYNPKNCPVVPSSAIIVKNGVPTLHWPLYATNVSRKFLDVVRDRLIFMLVVAPEAGGACKWEVRFVEPQELEERYVRLFFDGTEGGKNPTKPQKVHFSLKEQSLRHRFREYLNDFRLCENNGRPWHIVVKKTQAGIYIGE